MRSLSLPAVTAALSALLLPSSRGLFAAGPAEEEKLVALEFLVTPPQGTALDEKLYLAGNATALGSWSPSGVALERLADGRRRAVVKLPAGSKVEYKVTRGSWEAVEQDREGKDIPNRTVTAEKDCRLEIEVAAWRRPGAIPKRKPTLTGDVRRHEHFPSKLLANERTLFVYLPPGYETDLTQRYPVFYLHDGQNVFDEATAAFGVEWSADETAERLIRSGHMRPIIIAGIANTPQRIDEYTPTRAPVREAGGKELGGKGGLYARFLVEEVKPFIDKTYRTIPGREQTAVGGSSLGGLISLHMARSFHDAFGMCAALSPSLSWDGGWILRAFSKDASGLGGTRFWVDAGTREVTPGEDAGKLPLLIQELRDLSVIFDGAGLAPGHDYYLAEVALGEHNEAAWAARFDKVLLFFFAK
jgi:predicted alpha/beta superfamily hydrolase